MQGIREYLIQIEKPLNDTIMAGETELYIDPSFNQTPNSNRLGVVVSVPLDLDTNIEVGDQVMIIPTILVKQTYRGITQDSSFLLDKSKGIYRVAHDLIVLYKRPNSDHWLTNHNYVLVEPIKAEQKQIGSLIVPDSHFKSDIAHHHSGYQKQWGIARYVCESASYGGLTPGDKVFFMDYGEYEYTVDGQLLYLMDDRDVLIKHTA